MLFSSVFLLLLLPGTVTGDVDLGRLPLVATTCVESEGELLPLALPEIAIGGF